MYSIYEVDGYVPFFKYFIAIRYGTAASVTIFTD